MSFNETLNIEEYELKRTDHLTLLNFVKTGTTSDRYCGNQFARNQQSPINNFIDQSLP